MIRDDLFPLQFLKKEAFAGSYCGMRYHLEKKDDELEACVFPEPYSFDNTDTEKKTFATFPFSEEGYEEAKDWLEKMSAGKNWGR